MADIYHDPNTGNDGDNGTTWALAKATLQAALTAAGAGGRVFSQRSNAGGTTEVYTGNSTQTITSPGTELSPTLVFACANGTTNEPPVSTDLVADKDDSDLALFHNFSGGGAADISFNGYAFFYGYGFKAGGDIQSGGSNVSMVFHECDFEWGTGSGANRYLQTSNTLSKFRFEHTRFSNVSTGDKFTFDLGGILELHKCVFTGTGDSGDLVIGTSRRGTFKAEDTDFSSLTGLTSVFTGGSENAIRELIHCKMWTNWALVTAAVSPGGVCRAIQCDTDSDHSAPIIAYRDVQTRGSVTHDTTTVRNGSTGDGDTPFSYKLTPVASAPTEGLYPMFSPWMTVRVKTTDTQIEVYVHNTVADRDNSLVWLDVMSPNETAAASNAMRTHLSTQVGFLATPATLTDDTTTWNGTANYSQKIAVAIAPDTDGIAHVRVAYAQRDATPDPLYVDPTPVVT